MNKKKKYKAEDKVKILRRHKELFEGALNRGQAHYQEIILNFNGSLEQSKRQFMPY